MIIKLVSPHVSFVEGRINAFHIAMFHGEGRRDGVPEWASCDHQAGDDLSHPILYTCNGYRTPDLAVPSLHFIASAAARAALEDLPGLVFAPVKLVKVIYLPYAAGDFSYFERADFQRDPRRYGHETVFRRWADRPELHAPLNPRFEIVAANAYKLQDRYRDARELALPDPRGHDEAEPLRLCERMMSEHSLLWTARGTAFTPEAFNRVERFLDPDYYAVADVRID